MKADIFSVCVRIPAAILMTLLSQSGASGAFTEPRTPDGRNVLSQYVVIWASKLSPSELAHVMQTNPIIIGQARLGERRGLRVHEDHAQTVHQVLRPDSTFLPSGPRSQYVVGPFPWGSDRNAITKALRQSGWSVKALQPTQPVPGLGSMWIIQSVEPPPQSIFLMSHGEVVVSKHKQHEVGKAQVPSTVGSASTLTLCSHGVKDVPADVDPWLQADPWGPYNKGKQPPMPTTANAGLQQVEERIQNAVLWKLPAAIERDDVPDRIVNLENQVQMLMSKNQSLEGQFTEFSQQSTSNLQWCNSRFSNRAKRFMANWRIKRKVSRPCSKHRCNKYAICLQKDLVRMTRWNDGVGRAPITLHCWCGLALFSWPGALVLAVCGLFGSCSPLFAAGLAMSSFVRTGQEVVSHLALFCCCWPFCFQSGRPQTLAQLVNLRNILLWVRSIHLG